MIVNFTQNQALTTVRKVRLLPTWGKVLARVGQKVEADEVVAVSNSYPQHYLINIAKGLGCSVEECDGFLKRNIGDKIKNGSTIAKHGSSGRIIRAPNVGTILSIENGIVLLQSNSKVFELKAGFPGIVSEVMSDQGVTIESIGAYVQGVWGNGKHNSGSLVSFTSSPEEPLTTAIVKNKHNNIVSFAAWCEDPALFDLAIEKEWKGMIFGSLPAKLILQINKLPFPVLLTEGFGKVPINTFTYELLASHLGRSISIDALKPSSRSIERPDFFIKTRNDEIKPNPFEQENVLEIGSRVRILQGKYLGVTGTIAENIVTDLTLFPNNIKSQSVLVNLPDSNKVAFPLANIDVFM